MFTDEQILELSAAIMEMALLWDVTMSSKRLEQYVFTLTRQNQSMNFPTLMHSIALARMQDHYFPMPADILQREMRAIDY